MSNAILLFYEMASHRRRMIMVNTCTVKIRVHSILELFCTAAHPNREGGHLTNMISHNITNEMILKKN
jgi:hypothetical protein